jgi:hypothetical protein
MQETPTTACFEPVKGSGVMPLPYSKRERRKTMIFPRVILCDSLPQDILSSDKAAYHPATNTIYLRVDQWFRLPHELLHWLACVLKWRAVHHWIDGGRDTYR